MHFFSHTFISIFIRCWQGGFYVPPASGNNGTPRGAAGLIASLFPPSGGMKPVQVPHFVETVVPNVNDNDIIVNEGVEYYELKLINNQYKVVTDTGLTINMPFFTVQQGITAQEEFNTCTRYKLVNEGSTAQFIMSTPYLIFIKSNNLETFHVSGISISFPKYHFTFLNFL